MSLQIKWLGHGSWEIKTSDFTILLDPFIDENPAANCKAENLAADYILVSHGHFDHIADVAPIANRTNATVIGVFEITNWLQSQHQVQEVIGMNIGGGLSLPFGRVQLTHAIHSSSLPDGSYGGVPCGFVLTLEGKKIYFACDTSLFSDMRLIGQQNIDVAVLPIGDHFTMGPEESVEATKLIQPKTVFPAHYNTWPPIEQNAQEWAEKVRSQTEATPHTPTVGELVAIM